MGQYDVQIQRLLHWRRPETRVPGDYRGGGYTGDRSRGNVAGAGLPGGCIVTETGEYTISFYNRKGSKLRDKTLVVSYLTQARERGRQGRTSKP